MDTLSLSGIKLDPVTLERIGRTLIRLALCVGHPELPDVPAGDFEQAMKKAAS